MGCTVQKKAMKTKAHKKTAAKRLTKPGAKQTKKTTAKSANNVAGEQHPQVYYKLHALLHTVRTIGQYEDQLCTLMHAIKIAGAVDRKLSRELLALLEEMPSLEYQADLNTVRGELGPAGTRQH